MKRILAVILLLAIPAQAEDRAEVDTFLNAQSDRSYRDYQNWRKDQDAIERWEHRDRRPVKGNCTRTKYMAIGKAAWGITGKSNAEREARLAWERVVRSSEPEMYADTENAVPPPSKSVTCWKVGNDRRCKMEAYACKPS